MDNPTFEYRLRAPGLIVLYPAALSAASIALRVARAVVLSGSCSVFGVACAP